MQSKADVVIVQKQTALERYTRRPLNVDFLEYLERDGQSLEALKNAHNAHTNCRIALTQVLADLGLTFEIFNLDELCESSQTFFHPIDSQSGIQPSKGLVISLGGDGTLLHASHYVGGDITLLGINSCPEHSVGHLCAGREETMKSQLEDFVHHKLLNIQVRRLSVKTSSHVQLPLALNDILFCNRHPAATSRYHLTHKSNDQILLSEKQLSSGVWVSTPAGSTAAISSYGLDPLPLESSSFLCAVREHYHIPGSPRGLSRFQAEGSSDEIIIFSRMRQGLVCVDGPDSTTYLGFGETVHISSPLAGLLNLVTPQQANSESLFLPTEAFAQI
jgi:NAD+ kinase